MTPASITAELLDSNRIRCGVIMLRHRTPIFALARRLLAEGADPAVLLTVRWADTGTISIIEPIGRLAKLDAIERDNGERRFAAYRPREAGLSQRRAPARAAAAKPHSGADPPAGHPARAPLGAAE